MIDRRLFIEGTDYSEDVKNLEELEIEVFLNESTRTVNRGISSNIELKGAASQLIKDTYFANCDQGLDKELRVDFYEGKTDKKFEMIIDAKAVDYCFQSCRSNVKLQFADDETVAYNRLNSDWFYGRGGLPTPPSLFNLSGSTGEFLAAVDERMALVPFTKQPSFLLWILIYIRYALAFATGLQNIAFEVIDSIVDFIDGLFGGGGVDFNPIESAFRVIDNFITGNGNAAWAIKVGPMIKYQCELQGLQFVSSILNNPSSPYNDMLVLDLAVGRHTNIEDKEYNYDNIYNNYQGWTTIDFLEELMKLFGDDRSVEYRIVDNILYFEPRSFFYQLDLPVLADLVQIQEEQAIRVCYRYIKDDLPAYLDAQYAQDFLDAEGNKVLGTYYKDIQDFNDPNPTSAQEGPESVINNFGGVRCMFDIESFEKTSFLDYENGIDKFRSNGGNFFEEAFNLSNQGILRSRDLILSRGQLSKAKIFIGEKDQSDGMYYVKRDPLDGQSEYFRYNSDLHYNLNDDYDELVGRFLLKLNPRGAGVEKIEIQDIEIPLTKEALDIVMANGINFRLDTHLGPARADSVTIKFREGRIVLKKIKVFC